MISYIGFCNGLQRLKSQSSRQREFLSHTLPKTPLLNPFVHLRNIVSRPKTIENLAQIEVQCGQELELYDDLCSYLSIWFVFIAVCHSLFTLEINGAFRTGVI